ncbi:MAG: hypothetical protein H7A44_01970 [Opitutaceae bacterium]|nr:hypothetical protein [Cephaloticoccus sp.]MCP5529182.1 hypothetical protein [Opitutaceae bacterium]
MPLFALTTLEKLERVPVEFWLKMVMIVAIFALSIVLIRGISQVNKVFLTVLVFVVITGLGFHWVYERNEPKFMKPAIDAIAPFFPSKKTTTRW